ncbi:MAG: hypothetical protein ACWGQW_11265, partial [bacterium]
GRMISPLALATLSWLWVSKVSYDPEPELSKWQDILCFAIPQSRPPLSQFGQQASVFWVLKDRPVRGVTAPRAVILRC